MGCYNFTQSDIDKYGKPALINAQILINKKQVPQEYLDNTTISEEDRKTFERRYNRVGTDEEIKQQVWFVAKAINNAYSKQNISNRLEYESSKKELEKEIKNKKLIEMFPDVYLEHTIWKQYFPNLSISEYLDMRKNDIENTKLVYNHPEEIIINTNGKYILDNVEYNTLEEATAALWQKESFILNDKYDFSIEISDIDESNTLTKDYFETDNIEPESTFAEEALIELVRNLSEQIGVGWEFISQSEAKNININYNGQPAFFYQGKIYFIKDKINSEIVFHEFAHPILISLSKENPELFDKLYNDFVNTPEGVEIINFIKQRYNLDENSEEFKHEVLAQAISYYARKKKENLDISNGFVKFIKNLLYAIKQFFRKIFGLKIKISDLNENTSIKELAEILAEGGKFEINTDKVTEEDIIYYYNDQAKNIDDMFEAVKKESAKALEHTHNLYRDLSNQIEQLRKKKHIPEMQAIFENDFTPEELNEMRKNIASFEKVLDAKFDNLEQELQFYRTHAEALVHTYFRLQKLVLNIEKNVDELVKIDPDNLSKEDFLQANFYRQFLRTWKTRVNEITKDFSHMRNDSDMWKVFDNIDRTIGRIEDKLSKLDTEYIADILMNELQDMADSIHLKYTTIIDNMKKRNAPKSLIDRYEREYYGITQDERKELERLEEKIKTGNYTRADLLNRDALLLKQDKGYYLDKNKIKKYLKGDIGDANIYNSFFESYMQNTDPVIGGFALFFKNNMSAINSIIQKRYNKFLQEIIPLVEELGYNFNNPGQIGVDLGFEDKVAKREKDGSIVEFKVWRLLNKFKNWEYDRERYKMLIEDAKARFYVENTRESFERLAALQAEYEEWKIKYMHGKYKPEIYKAEELFTKDDIGKEAKKRLDDIRQEIRFLRLRAISKISEYENQKLIDEKYREMRMLYSQTDPLTGKKKEGRELEITKRLLEYREAMKPYYKEPDVEAAKAAFFRNLKAFENELESMTGLTDEERKQMRENWINNNTRIVYSDLYYKKKEELLKRLKELTAKLPDEIKKQQKLEEWFKEINDISYPYKDEFNEVQATAMTQEGIARIKELVLQIESYKKQFANINGLTDEEYNEMLDLFHKKKKGPKYFTKEDERRLYAKLNPETGEEGLYEKRKRLGLTDAEKREYFSILDELSELTFPYPTEDYVYSLQTIINGLSDEYKEMIHKQLGTLEMNKELADIFMTTNLPIVIKDENFQRWLNNNHILKNKDRHIISDSGVVYRETYVQYVRLPIWSVRLPSNEAFYETFVHPETKEIIQGLPSMNYYTFEIKDEYKTIPDNLSPEEKQKYVGRYIDNRGNWLPKSLEDGITDTRYINEDYYRLKNSTDEKDKIKFKLLEKLTEYHLENQKGLSRAKKLYLDFPREAKTNLEVVLASDYAQKKFNAIQRIYNKIKMYFVKARQNPDADYNYHDEYNLILADVNGQEIDNIQMRGLYAIESKDVSTDILRTFNIYMAAAEQYKKLAEINPYALALKRILEDPENNKDLNSIDKKTFISKNLIKKATKKTKNVRAWAINNFYEREFLGITTTGMGAESVAWHNLQKFIFGASSFSFFALNIPSALKNQYGAKFQGTIEAIGGKYFNMKTFAAAEFWSYAAMSEISWNLYNKGPKTLKEQIVEIFDPIQGRFIDRIGTAASRTLLKDVASMTWLYNFRKWTEMQATLQIFGALLMSHYITDKNGNKISYIDAFELKDGQITLKDNIDEKYAPGGKEFLKFQRKMHQIMNDLQGTYAKFDQPEAQRYLAFRFISFLRRYFTSMFLKRWAFAGHILNPKARYNPALGTTTLGYYIEFIRFIYTTARSLGATLPYITKEEAVAVRKVIFELFSLYAMSILAYWIFGWDKDDDDRYEKLREKSGPLPTLFTAESDYDFDLGGWFANHALKFLIDVRTENKQFIPLPTLGLSDITSLADVKSIALGPTLTTYENLFLDLYHLILNNESAYYSREIGPYHWQQKGSWKFYNHFLGDMLGMKGSQIDPVPALRNLESSQSRR